MPKGPIRRGQLISPFGVGAMVVMKDGTSLVTGGLDYWYRREDGNDPSLAALEEFKIEEWRLQRLLNVDHFRLPPDWREDKNGARVPNPYMTVPFLRFPTWHFCRRCNNMKRANANEKGRVECAECNAKYGRTYAMTQVPFIAICEQGHLMDFPWREWVHRDPNTTCNGTLKLTNTGGASLAGQRVSCSCGQVPPRNLAGITNAEREELGEGEIQYKTTLSTELASGIIYTCRGHRAWFGTEVKGQDCGRHVRGSLRSALNVYFADVRSAIYLPRGTGSVPRDLVEQLKSPIFSGYIIREKMLLEYRPETSDTNRLVDDIIKLRPLLEREFGRDVVEKAVRELMTEEETSVKVVSEDSIWDEVAFRHEEHLALREPRDEKTLEIRQQAVGAYGSISRYFSCIALVEKLRETRVLNGFTRISPSSLPDRRDRRNLMWREPDAHWNNWLPAQTVFGEGIYLELEPGLLAMWESGAGIQEHTKGLSSRFNFLASQRGSQEGKVTPRFLLVHTLAHLLMNQLTFSCGYSSATLRERLYVSDWPETNMAGLLIYTADGDADGTLGGLVRMGKPSQFESLINQAVVNASWCSADPICMEAAQRGGQGPDSLNLAACHSCALVPETACEEFNRLLDRTTIVGTPERPELGFFAQLIANI